MQDQLLNYGVLGIVVIGLCWFVMYVLKEHKKERNEWLAAMEKMTSKMNETEKENIKATRENSSILEGLKTLFEVRLKNL